MHSLNDVIDLGDAVAGEVVDRHSTWTASAVFTVALECEIDGTRTLQNTMSGVQ
jgi:hypothetical protein